MQNIDLTPFHFNEGTLQLPSVWKDLSVLVLSAADNDNSGISFTVSRDQQPWGMSFTAFAEREIAALSRQLKGWEERARESGTSSSRDCVTCEFRWRSTQGDIHQLMRIIDLTPKALILTATVPGTMDSTQRTQLLALFESLNLREPNDRG